MPKTRPEQRTWGWGIWVKLLWAGWRPGRNVLETLRMPPGRDLFPAAAKVLAEFGNLKFASLSEIVLIDPAVCQEDSEAIDVFEKTLNLRLFPLGYMEHQDRIDLMIDERGIIYTLIDDEEQYFLEPLASCFHVAIRYLVGGYMSNAEVRDDLEPIGMLNKTWVYDIPLADRRDTNN